MGYSNRIQSYIQSLIILDHLKSILKLMYTSNLSFVYERMFSAEQTLTKSDL